MKKSSRLLKIIIGIILGALGALLVLVVLYVAFMPRGEDTDFKEAVSNNAITANVLIINVTTDSNSTSYSAGQSGVIFKKESEKYYLLTALHGIPLEGDAKILILGYDQPTYAEADFDTHIGLGAYYSQFSEAIVEYYDETYDLAIISFISESEYSVLSIASEPPEYGEPVAAIGNPHSDSRSVVSTGKITSRNPVPFGDEAGKNQHNIIKHSAETSMGNSGGALLNKNMEIVGIVLGGDSIFGRFIVGKAMPCDRIIEFIEAWTAIDTQ